MTPESVPAPGKRVLIQYNGNHAVDVTAAVCAENRELCALAAEAVGLDIAGVDVIVEDIARPVAEQGGAVLEVNAMPGFMMHLRPAVGEPQPVDDAIVAAAMPEGEDGRIPIVAVYEDEELAAEIARRLGAPLASSAAELERMLLNPRLEVAVVAVTGAGIREEGLAFDRCAVAVCDPAAEGAELRLLRGLADKLLPPGGHRSLTVAALKR
jgi:cyanophycin synthetase